MTISFITEAFRSGIDLRFMSLQRYDAPMKDLLSAGAVPVRKKNNSWEFLILRSFNYWDFPKGNVEQDEDIWIAALREMKEEAGIEKVKMTWGKNFIETERYGKGKVARYYLVEVSPEVEIKIEANPLTGILEHHEYKWVPYKEARTYLVPRVQRIIDWAQTQIEDN